jgi:predicted TIM-barrel fold metal-dependent hydrolase
VPARAAAAQAQAERVYPRAPNFQSIQLHEGEQSLRHVIEAIGEDTLMFATDYPHSESWFPKSVDAVLTWTSISEPARRKLLWDNAARCYRRYGARAATAR